MKKQTDKSDEQILKENKMWQEMEYYTKQEVANALRTKDKEIEDWHNALNNALKQLADLQADNSRLNSVLTKRDIGIAGLLVQIEDLKAELKREAGILWEKTLVIDKQNEEISRLKSALSFYEKKAPNGKEITAKKWMQDTIDEQDREIKKLKKEKLEAVSVEIQNRIIITANKEKEISRLKQTITALESSPINSDKKLIAENIRLKKELSKPPKCCEECARGNYWLAEARQDERNRMLTEYPCPAECKEKQRIEQEAKRKTLDLIHKLYKENKLQMRPSGMMELEKELGNERFSANAFPQKRVKGVEKV